MPDPTQGRPGKRRTGRTRRAMVLGTAAVVAVSVGSGVAVALTRSSGTQYRLATVTRSTVDQTLQSVGTVHPINEQTVAFPVSGTVATTDVSTGSRVRAGQSLATLSTTDLEQQVSNDNAAIASAQQTLAADEASQSSTASSTSTSSSTTSNSSGGAGGST